MPLTSDFQPNSIYIGVVFFSYFIGITSCIACPGVGHWCSGATRKSHCPAQLCWKGNWNHTQGCSVSSEPHRGASECQRSNPEPWFISSALGMLWKITDIQIPLKTFKSKSIGEGEKIGHSSTLSSPTPRFLCRPQQRALLLENLLGKGFGFI